MREINDGRVANGIFRNRPPRRGVALALQAPGSAISASSTTTEIGGLSAIGDLDPHGRGRGVSSVKATMKIGTPGQVGDLYRGVGGSRCRDASLAKSPPGAPRAAVRINGMAEARILKRKHDTPLTHSRPL